MVDQSERSRVKSFAYQESIRGLSGQASTLDGLRTRTGILLTAITLTTTFIGGRALDSDGFTALAWVAIALFALAGLFALLVLLPWKWSFTSNAEVILDGYASEASPATLGDTQARLARFNQQEWNKNAVRLKWLFLCFRLSAFLLVLEVAVWLIALGSAPNGESQTTKQTSTQATPPARVGSGNSQAPTGGRRGRSQRQAQPDSGRN